MVPISCLVAGRDFTDPEGAWQQVGEISTDGALLVRPDQHVAWRVTPMPDDPTADLAAAMRQILFR